MKECHHSNGTGDLKSSNRYSCSHTENINEEAAGILGSPWLSSNGLGRTALGVVLPGVIHKEVIGSILTPRPPIVSKLVVAIQRMAAQFYRQECNWIITLAVQTAGGVILAYAPRKIPPLRRFI